MAVTSLENIIEAALLAAGKALTVAQLGELFEEHERPDNDAFRVALEVVAQRCEDRGFELQQVASGYRFQVRQSLSPWVARLWQERPQKYSRALLETLALIAYRQPITRGEIEEIRGVAVSSNIIKTLHEREWIRVVGHRDVPGRPAMYATTRQFLDYFNLKNLDQLPALAEIRDLETLNAELGFGEPLTPAAANAAAGPGLTVVGGTEFSSPDSARALFTTAPTASVDELLAADAEGLGEALAGVIEAEPGAGPGAADEPADDAAPTAGAETAPATTVADQPEADPEPAAESADPGHSSEPRA